MRGLKRYEVRKTHRNGMPFPEFNVYDTNDYIDIDPKVTKLDEYLSYTECVALSERMNREVEREEKK